MKKNIFLLLTIISLLLTSCSNLFEKSENTYRFVAGKNDKLTGISLKALAAKMRDGLNARGGGSEQMIQGSIQAEEKDIIDFCRKNDEE